MKVERSVMSGTVAAPGPDLVERPLGRRGARHAFQRIGMGVLERDVEVGKQPVGPIRHQGNKLPHMRVRVDIVQANPRSEVG
jgi:hypothetical protein